MAQENIEVTRLGNGVRVVSETVSHVQSISLGLWVGAGSRDERPGERGITHFIEHMLFKGTSRRTAREIADEIESRGGSLNAFTDKEYTCYYARALAEHLEIVMDVLCDMLRGSLLDPAEIGRERNVVLEEIKRHKDDPEESIHDTFAETLWGSHPLGRPVIGTSRSVGALDREDVLRYIERHYTPDRIVVSVAGNVRHADAIALAERFLGDMSGSGSARRPHVPQPSGRTRIIRRRTEQAHFCLGATGCSQTSDDRYALMTLDTVLGGNMSSRLFQEIREKRGLAYAIGSYSVGYTESGMFVVHGGTSPATFDQVIDLTNQEMDKVRRDGLTEEEIAKSRTQLRGNLMLGLESMSSRMMRMGKSMLYHGRVPAVDEVLAKIAAVDAAAIGRVAASALDEASLTLAAIGPLGAWRTGEDTAVRSEDAEGTVAGG